ncbi:MAG: hypothetical protein JNK16_05565 [Phycisphaerales bacterium]|nr:hypothetical protein [Phycisphaerales bacterium]
MNPIQNAGVAIAHAPSQTRMWRVDGVRSEFQRGIITIQTYAGKSRP